jgi:hypothetical protein
MNGGRLDEAIGLASRALELDPDRGDIAYAVVKFGGLIGMGEKLFAIPWRAFSLSLHDKKAILQVPRERLQQGRGVR